MSNTVKKEQAKKITTNRKTTVPCLLLEVSHLIPADLIDSKTDNVTETAYKLHMLVKVIILTVKAHAYKSSESLSQAVCNF